jgi:hypothetical protein
MKKLIALLFLFALSATMMAQERTVNVDIKSGFTWGTYVEYTGVAADTLKETNQDSISYQFLYRLNEAIDKIAFTIVADTLAGNDSIYYTLNGYNDPLGAATAIKTAGALFNSIGDILEISVTDTDSTDISYRIYELLMVQDGNNDYDGGAEVQNINLKIHIK